jgi:hypothetical protein
MRTEFTRFLKQAAGAKTGFSKKLDRSLMAMSAEDVAEEMGDLMGDAGEGDFDFISLTEDGAKLEKGVTPLAMLGTRGYKSPVGQCEGVLFAKSSAGKLRELFTVEVDGTLIPGSEKVAGKSFAALGLSALPKEEPKQAPKQAPKPKQAAPAPKPAPVKPPPTPTSELGIWWAELPRFGPGWHRELSREMGLEEGQQPTDRQLEKLFGKPDILVYVSGGVHDLTPLGRFRKLKDLGLDGHDRLDKLEILGELPHLRQLSLRKDNFRDIGFLARLTALESLDLSQNPLESYAPLAALTNLRKLDLGYTKVADLGPLSGLTRLRELTVWHSDAIVDLGPLAKLTRLEKLRASDGLYSDLSPLAGLVDLVSLDISGPFNAGKVTSLAALSGLKKLTWLDISDQPGVKDLAPLAGCTALEELRAHVRSPNVAGFDALLALKKLKKIQTHPSTFPKKDRDAFKKTRPKVELSLH